MMRKLVALLGWVILFGGITLAVVIPLGLVRDTFIWDAMTTAFCEEGETIAMTSSATGLPNTTSIGHFCADEAGERQRNLGQPMFLLSLTSILIGLFGGIGLIIASADTSNTVSGSEFQKNLLKKAQAKGLTGAYILNVSSDMSDSSLAEQLTELQEARDKGLISETEFRDIRQRLLDAFEDN